MTVQVSGEIYLPRGDPPHGINHGPSNRLPGAHRNIRTSIGKDGKTARPARRAHRATTAMSGKPASAHHDTTAAGPTEGGIREMAKTEWGVAYERGGITVCESEQAAWQLQAASGGELVYRRTWITTWS